ncbi:MAG: hypothetical protein KDA75_07710 [Planctomycetaceae bacterium]|nr:hypothetical protein [Planctomycetaceae bacterium]
MSSSPLKAPDGDGEVFSRPALDRVGAALAANRLIFESNAGLNLQGRTLADLREWSRRVSREQAHAYTRLLGGDDSQSPSNADPWIVTGHQPALFHPGVWAKNFAVDSVARKHVGVGLNLVVDSDLLTSTTVMAPRGSRASPRLEPVPFLSPRPAQPWEGVPIDAPAEFESFGSRVAEIVAADWGYDPVVAKHWSDAVDMREQSPRAADALTALRSQQERRWGLENQELPLSHLEESDPFRWFAIHLFAHAHSFRQQHNTVLAEYRRRNRIRSHAHPVPELRERAGWIETPFWIWKGGMLERSPVFIRPRSQRLMIAAGEQSIAELRINADADARLGVDDLAALSDAGWRLRSRALTTTLFARLFLADLFVHGIGGAKYDEMTDQIVERFYGMAAPAFLTLTATLRLPLNPFDVRTDHAVQLRRRGRDLHFNPNRVLNGPDAELVSAQKRELILEQAALRKNHATGHALRARRRELRRIHQRLQELNNKLTAAAASTRQSLLERLRETDRQLDTNRLLRSREYSWCLFPEAALRSLHDQIDNLV